MGIQISPNTTSALYNNNNSFGALPTTKFAFLPMNPKSLNYNSYSSGSVDSNTELLKGAMNKWANQNGVKLSDKEGDNIAELMAIKMHMGNLDPNSAEYRAYSARERELSQELLPTAAKLSSEIYSDPYENNPDKAMARMQKMMSNSAKNGIDDPDAWLKEFKQNLKQIPGWENAPDSVVDNFAKYVRSKVQQLSMLGSSGEKLSPDEQLKKIGAYGQEAEEHLDNLKDSVKDYLKETHGQSSPYGADDPRYYLPQNASDPNTIDMDKVLKDFIIQSISDSYNKKNGGSGNGSSGGSGSGGYSITISPTGLSNSAGSNQPVDATLQYTPSSDAGNDLSANNASNSSPSQSDGSGQFAWSTSSGGSFFHALLALAQRLADDYQKYTEGINADKFDMQSAAEFQTKTMQFTTCFGAIMKGLQGSLKQMKGTVDATQP